MQMTFDTLSVLKQLMQDNIFTEKQAEKMVEVLKKVEESHFTVLATKGDIKESESKLTLRLYTAIGGACLFLCAALPLLIKHM